MAEQTGRFDGVADYTALDLLMPVLPLTAAVTNGEALALLADHPDWPCVAVVDERARVIGMIDRAGLTMTFARPLLRDLYNKRSVVRLMRRDALVVDIGAGINEIGDIIAVRKPEALLSGFVITDGGVYAGIGSGLGLMGKALDQARSRSRALEAARNAAEEANKAKGIFLANISHEIRTPLNGVLANLELLKFTVPNREQVELVDAADLAAQMLLGLIGDVLDFSKIEADRLELEWIETDIGRLVQDTTALLASQAKKRGLALEYFIAPNVPKIVRADPQRIRQILINLCGNSLKFTEEGGVFVTLRSEALPGDRALLRFEVQDTGIGIDPTKAASLFEAFTQADGSTTRRFGGTGLGLTISRRLTDLMGGDIGCEGATNDGATFWFTTPVDVVEDSCVDRHALVGDLCILLIESDPVLRDRTELILADAGAFVSCVPNLAAAAPLLERACTSPRRYDVAIVDSVLPDGDGMLCPTLVNPSPCPMILLTGTADPSLSRRARRSGFSHVLSRPVDPDELVCAVAVAAGRRRSRSDLFGTVVSLEDRVRRMAAKIHGRRVLVLEDNPMNQAVIGRQLGKLGIDCDIAANGEIGLAMVQSTTYHLVFTDGQMPQMDGYEFTQRLRSWETGRGHRHPVIALTANALKGEAERCRAAGMDDYLTKPASLEKLTDMIDRWLPHNGTAAPGFAANSDAIDIKGLVEILGEDDPIAMSNLLRCYADVIGDLVEDMGESIGRRDRDRLFQSAHAAKGASRNAAARSLGDLCEELERCAQDAEWPLLEDLVEQARGSAEAVRHYVQTVAA